MILFLMIVGSIAIFSVDKLHEANYNYALVTAGLGCYACAVVLTIFDK